MEERGYYEAALRHAGLDGDANHEFDAHELILDEATAEAIDDLREEVRQLQLAIQQISRKLETIGRRVGKLEKRLEEVDAFAEEE